MSLTAIIKWLENGCDPLEAVKELKYHNTKFAELQRENAELKSKLALAESAIAESKETSCTYCKDKKYITLGNFNQECQFCKEK